ncbi:Oligoribonuclease (3'-_5' exoribonuclease) [Hahella chejuensis KCTC 2396]|uniref:Oligoribonuclease n=1 Tax=Hahella chejuensis (strain KCTC 2396) TaxID=349521 RepID=ORN_HAHCH|nr:oligoribonuclease [Hahella chejuensis]Q2SBB4.1 RecName: Full=Oligoribonuclease [Hahella chejuensis KCTC 2396]ABC32060.1 Oligoribonuclease (3'->5' exoribonuclease) [Hahella chejuensis KCTC 2396]
MSRRDNLIWIDLEMTGLDPDSDRIIEMAVVVTTSNLELVAEGPVIAVHQPDSVLALMDDWNRNTHGASGLTGRVKGSTIGEADAEKQILDFLAQHVDAGCSPMCGNSIGQDRRFLARYMKDLEKFFHYRNLDVSTLKELARRWRPEVAAGIKKKGSHQALEDIRESVEELRYYREHFLRLTD